MISYAQNHEDVVLARAFDKQTGFYIDVGAGSPVIHSVTNHFYQRGWRGVNIEPLELWHKALVKARPGDINLAVGVSDERGVRDFYDVSANATEESTFSVEVAEALRSRGLEPQVRSVNVTTLAAICEEYAHEHIDFLKVDVEGLELQVLRGGNWDRFRPSVVVVESTRTASSRLADDADEIAALLADAGYSPALFDGLNTFYARASEERLRSTLAAPANPNDRFEDAKLVELRESHRQMEGRLDASQRRLHDAEVERDRAETRVRGLERDVEHARRAVAALEDRIGLAQQDVARASRDAADAQIQFQATREALEQQLAAQPE
jgi:FkbM family methyltransferase